MPSKVLFPSCPEISGERSAELSPSFAACSVQRSMPDLPAFEKREILSRTACESLGAIGHRQPWKDTLNIPSHPPSFGNAGTNHQKISALTSSGGKDKSCYPSVQVATIRHFSCGSYIALRPEATELLESNHLSASFFNLVVPRASLSCLGAARVVDRAPGSTDS